MRVYSAFNSPYSRAVIARNVVPKVFSVTLSLLLLR